MNEYEVSACRRLSLAVACSALAGLARGDESAMSWFYSSWGQMTLAMMGKTEADLNKAIRRVRYGEVEVKWSEWLQPGVRNGKAESI